ncbi:MAG TPA: response regulator transcription factor [Acidimicrobiales bacterium]|nr:response regulator transcription factor [Acidimicrobiales bacterium]
MSHQILVVDDDERVRIAVTWQLQADGYTVTDAADGPTALDKIERESPDLVILDLSLPGIAGLDVLRRIRASPPSARGCQLPIIVLSGRSGDTDRVVVLDLGADDYLVKPFSTGELAARVRSLLRRSYPANWTGEPPPPHGLHINETTREVAVNGQPVDLTAKEFDLLAFLNHHPRQVFSRAELLQYVWSSAPDWQCDATVTEHVHRLRQKVERDHVRPRWIHTVRGVGYRLEP